MHLSSLRIFRRRATFIVTRINQLDPILRLFTKIDNKYGKHFCYFRTRLTPAPSSAVWIAFHTSPSGLLASTSTMLAPGK